MLNTVESAGDSILMAASSNFYEKLRNYVWYFPVRENTTFINFLENNIIQYPEYKSHKMNFMSLILCDFVIRG